MSKYKLVRNELGEYGVVSDTDRVMCLGNSGFVGSAPVYWTTDKARASKVCERFNEHHNIEQARSKWEVVEE